MTREVMYERTVTGSYMKVPMASGGQLDEKILLRKNLPGLLPMEKVFINQGAWYWYDISGKQSLDHYCRVRSLEGEMLERIVISICKQIENMKQHYLSPNCLVLDSEYIFICNQTQQIVFMAYPGETQLLEKGFQMLVEYLLTKIDHKDVEAVRKAYGIYEKTLDEAYTLEEIRDTLIMEKKEDYHEVKEESYARPESNIDVDHQESEEITSSQSKFEELMGMLREWKENLKKRISNVNGEMIKSIFHKQELSKNVRKEKKSRSLVVMPEDLSEDEEEIQETIHPTICLSDYREHPRGLLLYEGTEDFENILLNGTDQQIGKSKKATVCINKDTISSLHAGIWFEEQEYFLEDYNSTNGTYVNNEPLAYKERRKLQCNDIVRFADVKYRFV